MGNNGYKRLDWQTSQRPRSLQHEDREHESIREPGQAAPRQDPGSKEAPDTIQHMTAVCSMAAGKEDVERHNQVAGTVFRNISTLFGLDPLRSKTIGGWTKSRRGGGATAVVVVKNSNMGRIGCETEQDVKISAIPGSSEHLGLQRTPGTTVTISPITLQIL